MKKSAYIAAAAATVLVPLGLFLRTFSPSPLPKPEPLLRMIAVKERLPELIIVPAHDMRAFAAMPALSQPRSETSPGSADLWTLR